MNSNRFTSIIGSLMLAGLAHIGTSHAAPPKTQPPLEELFPDTILTAERCRAAGGTWRIITQPLLRVEACERASKWVGAYFEFKREAEGAPLVLNRVMSPENSEGVNTEFTFWPSGALKSRAIRVHDQVDGVAVGYWEQGAVRYEQHFVKGKREGPWQVFAPSGAPTLVATYANDQLEGHYTTWHGDTCAKESEGDYHEDKEQGLWRTWTNQGVLASEGSYERGTRVGTWRFFHPRTRALVEEGPYVDGKRQGMWTEYFASGHKFRDIEYVDDMRRGDEVRACAQLDGATWNVDFEAREEGCQFGQGPWATRILTWRGYYPEGQLRWQRSYSDGKVDGMETDYHLDGSILHRGLWKGGVPDGQHAWRAPQDGALFGESRIAQGAGTWRAFFETGKPKEAGVFVNGGIDGVWQTWFENGNLATEDTYIKGEKTGPMRAWFESGQLKVEGAFKNGDRAGTWTAWWSNGYVSWTGPYDEKGDRTGVWREYYSDGTLQLEGPLVQGERQGHWVEYFDNGVKEAEGEYGADQRQGSWQFWWKDGSFWRTAEFKDGVELNSGDAECKAIAGEWVNLAEPRLTGCQTCRWEPLPADTTTPGEAAAAPGEATATPAEPETVHPDGAEDPAPVVAINPGSVDASAEAQAGRTVKNLERRWVFWHPNGKKEKEGAFRDGKPDGDWTFWYPSGDKMLEGRFALGVEDGAWAGWYENGQKKFSGVFKQGVEDGAWETWAPNGKSRSEGSYVEGKKNGVWVYFHDNGAKRAEGTFDDNEESGAWTTFYPSGKRRGEGSYVHGKRDGAWTWYREDGSVWRSATYAEGKEAQAR